MILMSHTRCNEAKINENFFLKYVFVAELVVM